MICRLPIDHHCSSNTCQLTAGILPFTLENPASVGFEFYKDYFDRPISSFKSPIIGDKIKIFCVERGD